MRTTGTVKWFNDSKGYGFLSLDAPERDTFTRAAREAQGETEPDYERGMDVFVHASAIHGTGFRSLSEGEAVEFNLIQASAGLAAENVVRIG